MSNILVLGVSPLPFEVGNHLYAPGIRTWQITELLAQQRHYVTLCVIDFEGFTRETKPSSRSAVREDVGHNINLIRMTYSPEETISALKTLHLATRFSAIISTTDVMNALVADLQLGIPAWLDYNGDPLAEKQLQASVYAHDGSLKPQWNLYLKGLLAGDHFSVCSAAQRFAMIGQLAYAGRLTGSNAGKDLVSVIPNCSRFMSSRTPVRAGILKGTKIPASAFLVLWSGGYNTWSDTESLFYGLQDAMKSNPAIYFVSTGGAIAGHDTKSFQQFQDLVQSSDLKDRFIFAGWVPTDEVGSYYEQADMAIFTDKYSVEGELGARTRLIDWIQFKLPIACTVQCELSKTLADLDMIKTFSIGDSKSITQTILDMADSPGNCQDRAERAYKWFETEMKEEVLFAPLTHWVQSLNSVPDRDRTGSELSHILLQSNISSEGQQTKTAGVRSRLRNFFNRKN